MQGKTLRSLLVFLIGSCVFAADSPSTYNAITDTMPRPEPPLPALGPAGSKINDPTFGTRILRVTDANTHPDIKGSSFTTPGGSWENNWNADTTLFWVLGNGGAFVYRFDGAAFQATPYPDPKNPARQLILPWNGPWSYRKPNVMYGTAGRTIIEYDFNTHTSRTVLNGDQAVPGASGYAYTPAVSDDDSKLCLAFGGIQNTHYLIAWLDRNTGKYEVLDTKNSRLNGQPTNMTMGYGLHAVYMDRTGRYVIINKGDGRPAGASEWAVWDVQARRVYDMLTEWSGHDASGFGVRVNQSGFYGGNPPAWEEVWWAVRGLGEPDINNIRYLLPSSMLPTEHHYVSGHHSWNNARPDMMVPIIGSIVRKLTSTAPWRQWDNEIVGVATDGSGRVYRFCHHRAKWDTNFWDDPHGNVSQNGRFFAFTSNWGYAVGSGRRDVFVVELPAGNAPAPNNPPPPPPPPPADTIAPTVSITAPANGQTLQGTVKVTAAAQDNTGVAGVQFLVNGAPLGAEDTVAPYEASWTPPNGSYSLTARARDAAGNSAQCATVNVTVSNPAAPPPATDPGTSTPPPASGSTYSAVTDLTARPQPATPALGAAGTVITDPTFGTKILRVTDGNTQPAYRNASFRTASVSYENTWNADGTRFWVHGRGGIVVYRFDAAAMSATPVPDPTNTAQPLVLPESGPFSYRRANVLYLTRGRTIVEYDLNTNASRVVFDANAAVPAAAGSAQNAAVSDDDTKLALAFGGSAGTHPYVAVLDRGTGRYSVLDTMNSKLNGQAPNKTLGFGIRSARFDRSGRFVILQEGTGASGSPWTVWDVSAGRVYDLSSEYGGEHVTGFGRQVNQSGIYGGSPSFWDDVGWSQRTLTEADVNRYSYLVPAEGIPSPHQSIYSAHYSWANAKADMAAPVVGAIVRDSRSTAPWRAWDNEIVAISTDGSGKVYRLAHHRSKYDRMNEWDTPRGNVSQCGRYYVFTSNWDQTLGTDAYENRPRQDVFVVALPAAGSAQAPTQTADTTPPSVALGAPANGATVSGTVTISASASDDKGVAGVQILIDGKALGAEVTAAPYAAAWDTRSVVNGQHTVAAVARDAAGNRSTATVTVTVNNALSDPTPPSVALTAPVPGASVYGAVSVSADASDNVGVASVEFFVNGQSIGTDTAAPWTATWNQTAGGSYSLTAKARDAAGNVGTSAAVTVTVTPAPTAIPSNLLLNPGFELSAANWFEFDQVGRTLVSYPVKTGLRAVSIAVSSSAYRSVHQRVPVQAGQTYKASAWAKLAGIGANGAGIVVVWLDASSREIREDRGLLNGTLDWTLIQRSFVAPSNAAQARFSLFLFKDPDNAGTAVFDDVYFGR